MSFAQWTWVQSPPLGPWAPKIEFPPPLRVVLCHLPADLRELQFLTGQTGAAAGFLSQQMLVEHLLCVGGGAGEKLPFWAWIRV